MSDPAPPNPAASPDAAEDAITRVVEIVNKKGLHARASAKFVQIAERYKSAITVTRGNETVGGTSIMGLMMLAAGPGTLVTVKASGPDAIDAMDALCTLMASGFGEEE
jgi:phosphocarrier protein